MDFEILPTVKGAAGGSWTTIGVSSGTGAAAGGPQPVRVEAEVATRSARSSSSTWTLWSGTARPAAGVSARAAITGWAPAGAHPAVDAASATAAAGSPLDTPPTVHTLTNSRWARSVRSGGGS